jgi:hypothetical protein
MSAFGGRANVGLNAPQCPLPKAELMTQSRHERLRVVTCNLTVAPHSTGRKTLL